MRLGAAGSRPRFVDTALAIDVGGTKLAVARVDAAGLLTDRHTAPTPARGDAEDMWSRLADLVAAVSLGDEVVVGVGCGGPMGLEPVFSPAASAPAALSSAVQGQ